MILRRVLILLCALLLAGPAAAHSLRVFARVEGGQVSGYGFFIGGGRPQGVDWQAQMGPETIARGQTDARGSFGFPAPATVTGDVVVTVNTGEGHIASTTLKPERFGGAPMPAAAVIEPAMAPDGTGAALSRADVEAAVAAQVAPLMERIEQMDARMRLTDLLSGVFLILGLAGMALWARGRRG